MRKQDEDYEKQHGTALILLLLRSGENERLAKKLGRGTRTALITTYRGKEKAAVTIGSAPLPKRRQGDFLMMSSEEDVTVDSFGLLKKTKRSRQRVDAGEPRNSYSSIPNFSSRPNLLNSGIYGAFFAAQNHQHFASSGAAYFNQGFGPTKMLNELLSRRVKTITDNSDAMMTIDVAGNDMSAISGNAYDRLNSQSPVSRVTGTLNGGGDMDIIEANEHDSDHRDNNEVSPSGQNNDINSLNKIPPDNDSSSSEGLVSSPGSVSNKDDIEESNKEFVALQKVDKAELKRARVENIVSCMRSSPLPVPVNGCKKRKLYHPQQHDNSVVERFANSNDVVDPLSEDEDENLCSAEIRKKVVEKNALKNQLRTVQEQLAEMQQKYVQLCTRMDQDSLDTPEQEEITSDVEEEDENSIPSPDKNNLLTPTLTPTSTPVSKEQSSFPTISTPTTQTSMSPAIAKMLNSKFLPQNTNVIPHINSHSFPLHPNFNGALSFLQQQMFQEQQHAAQNHLQPHHHHPHHHHPAHSHPALSNAAAMYLGVSQKLLMEQEARMAKEVALVAEHQQQLNNQNMANVQQNQQQNSQHMGHSQPHSSIRKETSSPSRLKTEQSPSSQGNQQSTQHYSMSGQNIKNNEFSERLQIAKNNNNSNPSTSFDLEGLAEALKSEITSTLTNLIDTIVTRFLQQKRLSAKSSEATLAAEQLNKDLLLASQLLDRKSPRTKVIDRGNCVSSTEKTNSSGYSSSNSFNTPTKSSSHSNSSGISQSQNYSNCNPENNINAINLPSVRSALNSNLFPPPKVNTNSINNVAAAALYSSMNNLSNSHISPFCLPDVRAEGVVPEQNEALSLVVAPKKKRHKVTDTRITPRTVSRILAQDGIGCPPSNLMDTSNKFASLIPPTNGSSESPPPRPFHVPHSAPMLPVSLPTSVAIPNPGLHESQVFSPYSPFYGQHQGPHHMSSSPTGIEFYYIQMEKYARAAIQDGIKNSDDLHVSVDCDIYRVLNLHYNRNNHIEVPSNFRYVVEQTLKEFFKAIQTGKDQEQSWKKSIYKVVVPVGQHNVADSAVG
ncbi:hypothetical protein PGB90_004179 [Kerria lacca]